MEKRAVADREYKAAEDKGDKEKMETYNKRKTKIHLSVPKTAKSSLDLWEYSFKLGQVKRGVFCIIVCIIKNIYDVAMDALTFGVPIRLSCI